MPKRSDIQATLLAETLRRAARIRLTALRGENPLRYSLPPGFDTPTLFQLMPKQAEAMHTFCPDLADAQPDFDWVTAASQGKLNRKKLMGFMAGNRAGKSEWATRVAIGALLSLTPAKLQELPQEPRTWKLGPPRLFWAMMPTFERSRDTQQRYIWERLPRCLMARGTSWNPKKGFHGAVVPLINGSRIVFKTAEQRLETYEGDPIHGFWADEAMPLVYIQAALVRCTDYRGFGIWTAWPSQMEMQEAFIERRLSREAEQLSEHEVGYVAAGMADNVYLHPDEIKLLEKTSDPSEIAGRIYGRFDFRQGLVYPEYNESLHVRGQELTCPLPADWTLYELIDPGWANPCAVNFCAVLPDGTFAIYDEIYVRHHTVAEIAALIMGRRWKWSGRLTPAEHAQYEQLVNLRATGLDTLAGQAQAAAQLRHLMDEYRRRCGGDCAPHEVQIDEAARQKKQGAAADELAQFAEMGIRARSCPNKPKEQQQKLVRDALRPLDGRIRLWVAWGCTNTRWEFKNHGMKPVRPELREYAGDREIIVDTNNHAISNLERWLASKPLWRRPESLRRRDDAETTPRSRHAKLG